MATPGQQNYTPLIQHVEQYPTDYTTGLHGSVLSADPAANEPGMVVRIASSGAGIPITPGSVSASGSISALNGAVTVTLGGAYAGGAIYITGSAWTGTLAFEGTEDGSNWIGLNSIDAGTGTVISSVNRTGLFRVSTSGLQGVRCRASAWVSGTATVTVAGAFESATKFINAPLPNSAAYGVLKTSGTGEPGAMFNDIFDGAVIDTTNRWNAPAGTLTPTQSASALSFPVSTTANAFGRLTSQATFPPQIPGWVQHSWLLQVEASPVTNTHRAWGFMTAPTTPTTAAPLTDFIGFEIGTDGILRASVYNAGTRIFSQALDATASQGTISNNQQPLDGAYHRYICQVRTDVVYFYINTPNIPVATFQAGTLAPTGSTQNLPLGMQLVNGTPTTGATFNIQGAVVADTAQNQHGIKDRFFPWRSARVGATGQLLAAAALGSTSVLTGSAGTASVPSGAWVTSVSAIAPTSGATITLPWASATVTLPTLSAGNATFSQNPTPGTLVGPYSIVFTSTLFYVVEYVVPAA